ncbi:MAG: ATP-binding protein [candidate division WOR-3 bacterium]|nr:ATP-binding protein [candidate division WOR-3 bacterium]
MRRAVLAATLALCATAASAVQLPAEARLLWEFFSPSMTPIDLNGDSSDELLAYESDNYVVGRDQQLLVASASRRFTADTRRAGPPFAVNETLMWVPRTRNDSLFLWPLWHGREVFCFTIPTPRPGDFWDGSVGEIALQDLDGDGAAELVVLVRAGFARWPRGVAAFDLKTGHRLWFFETGPNPEGLVLRDVDGDGAVEIMFGSVAPGNGHEVPGSDDDHSYVFCLRHDGSSLWQREIGRFPQHARITSFRDWLLVHEQGSPVENAEPDSVFVLDPLTGTTRAAAQLGQYGRGAVTFGDSLIVTAATDDTLTVYDHSLRVLRKRPLNAEGATEIRRGSFTASGRAELAVATTSDGSFLLDADLNLLAHEASRLTDGMATVNHNGRQRLLVTYTEGGKYVWRLYEFNRLPLLRRQVSVTILLVGAGGFLLLFIITFVGLRHSQTRDMRAVIRGLTGQAGVVELDRRGRIRRANSKGRELLQATGATQDAPLTGALAPLGNPARDGSAPRELPLSLPTGQTILARATSVKTGTLLTLEDISAVEYMKRVTSWAPVAQKLAHDIKNPLTAISLTLQRVEKAAGPDSQRYVDSMKEDIDRLKKMADGFMRLTKLEPPKLAPTDLNEVVRQCAGKFEGVKPPGVDLMYDMAEDLPSVALDHDQMGVACSNIIENAVSAIVGSGVVTIRTWYIVGEKRVAVSVTDTGKGIPERYLAKVFEPYFTLKAGGTGLGMALTKRIIDDHKGTIRIDSKEGTGTTVTVELPVAGTGSA